MDLARAEPRHHHRGRGSGPGVAGRTVESLWFFPAVSVLIALAMGAGLARIDVSDDASDGGLLFEGSAEEARQLLTVVAGTMITVTGLVFVLTVIALQIASTQFSPRLLRTFLRDRGTQLVLSTFVATFAYAIAGLHTVGRAGSDGEPFVPRVAITGAMALALASLGMLVFYIQHITNSIRVDTIMVRAKQGILDAIRREHPEPVGAVSTAPPEREPDGPAGVTVPTPCGGYLEEVYAADLVRIATDATARVDILLRRGQHALAGRPLAHVVADNGQVSPAELERAGEQVARTVVLLEERTVESDVGFGIRQLVDIAVRAMSPALNDPYTAVQAVHHLTDVFGVLASYQLGDRAHRDDQGAVRVIEPGPDFGEYLAMASGEIRQQASSSPRLMVELLHMLTDVGAQVTTDKRRDDVAGQVALVVADAERSIAQPADLEGIYRQARQAALAIGANPQEFVDAAAAPP